MYKIDIRLTNFLIQIAFGEISRGIISIRITIITNLNLSLYDILNLILNLL